jgi:hypothetical protein
MEMAEPQANELKTLTVEPNLAAPNNDKPEDNRVVARKDSDDPKVTKSTIDIALPKRANDLTDKVLPKLK